MTPHGLSTKLEEKSIIVHVGPAILPHETSRYFTEQRDTSGIPYWRPSGFTGKSLLSSICIFLQLAHLSRYAQLSSYM